MKSFNELIPRNFYGLHFKEQNRVMFFEFIEIIAEYTEGLFAEIDISKIIDFDIESNEICIYNDSEQSFSYTLSKDRLRFLKEISGDNFNKLFSIYCSLKNFQPTSIKFIYDLDGIELNKYYHFLKKGTLKLFKPIAKTINPDSKTSFSVNTKNYIEIIEYSSSSTSYSYEKLVNKKYKEFYLYYSEDAAIIELTKRDSHKIYRTIDKFEKLKDKLLIRFLDDLYKGKIL